jgi:5-methylcytosine-specific restriction protein A
MTKSQYANWYADRRWRAKRAAHLTKEPLCRYCTQEGRIAAADVVDHIEPHKGDKEKFWYGELQSLCHTCHSSRKQREEMGVESRMQKRLSPNSHWRR